MTTMFGTDRIIVAETDSVACERKANTDRQASTMTATAVPPYHHGMPVKLEQRTESPPLVQQSFPQDCGISPASSERASVSPLSSGDSYTQQHPGNYSSQIDTNQSHLNVAVQPRDWSKEGKTTKSLPNQSKERVKKTKAGQAPAKKRQNSKVGSRAGSNGGSDKTKGNSVTARRQKRLERNRESARLSRRRRKQYLEVLEERVSQLAVEVDKGRREHAARAIDTILERRREILQNNPQSEKLSTLDLPLSRSSAELSILSTFYAQQLKSFSLPPHSKFVLWLTLQGDTYFRGGRAASERLSAARIGERMLISGNDKVSPARSMWPLVCNEVGLSYDQEERVRNFQRTLLQTPSTWLDRHTAKASAFVMQSFHDSMNTVAQGIQKRECIISKGLTAEQRLKFSVWAEQNADRIKGTMKKRRQKQVKINEEGSFQVSDSHHVAANLYILNHQLQKVISSLPKRGNILTPANLKRLSRRPSFESLGQQKEEGMGMTREGSFASTGSLKSMQRSSSSLSMNDSERPHPQQVSPEEGQKEAGPILEKELGFVKTIIPPSSPPTPVPQQAPIAIPANLPRSYHSFTPQAQAVSVPNSGYHYPAARAPAPYTSPVPSLPHQGSQPVPSHSYNAYNPNQQTPYYNPYNQSHYNSQDKRPSQSSEKTQQSQAQSRKDTSHARKSSFLPPHLNEVSEEMFGSGDGAAEDFFMSLIDEEDWAIGEGIDMDAT